ncbi:M20/M25/M40 family metallo-hydrolase [Actinomadura chokoriensis]|uniref:M20/M25/M40 family metallo-hydrolase n=1 Tax=Actinomadura chokoriensis TaxID=454156 RepID=UPI0031F9D9E2
MSVTDNTTVATMPRISRAGLLDTGRRAATVRDMIDRLGIRPPRPEMPVRHLSAWVAQALADAGFDVEHVGICAECDALPGIGHACGHTIIAAAAVGAGAALAGLADGLGLTVTVLGIPGEEGGGGKIMLERGAFDGMDAAMTVHPAAVGRLAELKARVLRRFEAGVLATGCDLATAPVGLDYADLRPDAAMLSLYRANAEALGRVFPDLSGGSPVGAATDMGNVSHVVPTLLGLDCLPAVNHRPEFTAACVTPAADKALLDGATAMAWTAIGLAYS